MVENELQYLSWDQFRRMAPSILRLEVTRLGRLVDTLPLDDARRNAYVKARYEIKRFISCLETVEQKDVAGACVEHLRVALLNVSMDEPDGGARGDIVNYVRDRLRYVIDRVPYVF